MEDTPGFDPTEGLPEEEEFDAHEELEDSFELDANHLLNPLEDLENLFANGHLQASIQLILPHLQAARASIAAAQAVELELFQALLEAVVEESFNNKHPDAGTSSLIDGNMRLLRAEIACALNMSEYTVINTMNKASRMLSNYRLVHTALSNGDVSLTHANIIVDAGVNIDDQASRDAFAERLLKIAGSQTPGRLRTHARSIAEEYTSVSIDDRFSLARECRDVKVRELHDGIAEVTAILDSATAQAIVSRVDQLTAEAKEANPGLLTGEIRANVFADLLLTGDTTVTEGVQTPSPIVGQVRVTIPFLTMTGLHDAGPAELEGLGPIDLQTARSLAAEAPIWERVLTDPLSGVVVAVDRYRPSPAMRLALAARDEHCRFPGCRRNAVRCDLDHTKDWQYGGKTEIPNLAHLCRGHHSLKHAVFVNNTRWKVKQVEDGVLHWESPLGKKYVDRPPSTVRFEPPPPF